MQNLLKFLVLTLTISTVACNYQSASQNNTTSEKYLTESLEKNRKGEIISYMTNHDLWGLEIASKSEAQYYRVLLKELPKKKYLVQDFYISGKKLTSPYILTDGQLKYNDNEDVAHPNNYYPREGEITEWYESGTKKIESYYKKNKPTGLWIEYFENGQKSKETPYHDGEINGTSKTWNDKGVLIGECSYISGKADGRCYSKLFDQPNSYISESEYKKDEEVGISKLWNPDGTLDSLTFNEDLSLDYIRKNLSDEQFKLFIFDVNQDNIKDILISRINDENNLFQGDELYVLTGDKNNKYTMSLSTSNHASDGGDSLSQILPRPNGNGFILNTQFSSKGYPENKYYYTLKNNRWYISTTSSEGHTPTGQFYYCVDKNEVLVTDYVYKIDSSGSDEELAKSCPLPANKYVVTSNKAEILTNNFKPRNPPNYFIKGDTVTTDHQNEDWVSIRYKNNSKTGWISKNSLKPINN